MLTIQMETSLGNGEVHSEARAEISISRPAYTQSGMVRAFDLHWQEEPKFGRRLKTWARGLLACTGQRWRGRLLRFLPFVGIMRAYQWRSWLVLDLISGLSISVVHIPQGMGFALLTSVPPVYGLYSSLFPPLIYFFLGTSRHLSLGTMALTSLMIGGAVDREAERLGLVATPGGGNGSEPWNGTAAGPRADVDEAKVGIALSISLLVGCLQLAMGLVGLGKVATFMSMPFIGGFLTASAVHIVTSQASAILGLGVAGGRHAGLFALPRTYLALFGRVGRTNVAALVTGLVGLAALILIKHGVNERLRFRMKAPVPAELVVVVVGTLASHYARLGDRYRVQVIGPVPSGIPRPRVPPMAGVGHYVGDAVVVAVVSFVVSVSMAKLMAKRHGYAIDVNQELYAYGISHAVGSFLNCFAGAQAPPRTLLHDSIGGKTQLSGLVSCAVVLLVCLFLGRLLASLPVPVLAAVIVVALLPMFEQFGQLPTLWRVNKYDFFVWLLTFASGVVFDVTTGLVVGMGVSVFFVVLQAHFASASVLVALGDSGIYLDRDRLRSDMTADRPGGVVVVRFDAALYFVNVERFKTQLYERAIQKDVGEDNDPYVISMLDIEEPEVVHDDGAQPESQPSHHRTTSETNATKPAPPPPPPEGATSTDAGDKPARATHAVVLDCAAMSYIDIMGINTLKMVRSDLRKLGVEFCLACVPTATARRLEMADACSSKSDDAASTSFTVYPTVQDAVAVESAKARRS